jgi:hypothetical protein
MLNYIYKIVVIIIFTISPIIAADESGGVAGSFLDWGIGARAISMGNTYSAIADDGTALIWNPAGLTQIAYIEFTTMYALIFEDRQLNYFGFSYPLKNFSISLGWQGFSISDIQERGSSGELMSKFDDSENVFILGSGYKIYSNPTFDLNAGLGLKYFYHLLFDYHATGMGVDAGLLSNFQLTGFIKQIAVGVTVQNIAAKMKWNTESNHSDTIPINARLGSAFYFSPIPLILAVDVNKKNGSDFRLHSGLEYRFKMLAIRTGLNNDRLSAGLGLELNFSPINTVFNYAYSNDEIANSGVHFFSLILRF